MMDEGVSQNNSKDFVPMSQHNIDVKKFHKN